MQVCRKLCVSACYVLTMPSRHHVSLIFSGSTSSVDRRRGICSVFGRYRPFYEGLNELNTVWRGGPCRWCNVEISLWWQSSWPHAPRGLTPRVRCTTAMQRQSGQGMCRWRCAGSQGQGGGIVKDVTGGCTRRPPRTARNLQWTGNGRDGHTPTDVM